MSRLINPNFTTEEKAEEFQKAVQHVFDWLHEIGNPYLEVHITMNKASVVEDSLTVFEDERELK